jgi:O-6-methylguanine DNA methyltransferase
MFKKALFETPLGVIYAVSDNEALHYLGFNEPNFPARLENAEPLLLIGRELDDYFKGGVDSFRTPLFFNGSHFQIQVWNALQKIPFGETRSYNQIASAIQNPKACRAVGLANGVNPFVIIIPCHRVIGADGSLSGYSAGLNRKQWLLNHEKNRLISKLSEV